MTNQKSGTQKKVARWTTADIQPAEHGGFVSYGDYLKLERELSAANAKLAEAKRLLAKFALGYDTLNESDTCLTWQQTWDLIKETRAWLTK